MWKWRSWFAPSYICQSSAAIPSGDPPEKPPPDETLLTEAELKAIPPIRIVSRTTCAQDIVYRVEVEVDLYMSARGWRPCDRCPGDAGQAESCYITIERAKKAVKKYASTALKSDITLWSSHGN
jgi:hypothetical protein